MASETRKVVVHLRATGDAPILKQAKFKIAGADKFVKVIDFLRRQLHRETLFVYVNSAFSPNPDELVIDLYNWSITLAPWPGDDYCQMLAVYFGIPYIRFTEANVHSFPDYCVGCEQNESIESQSLPDIIPFVFVFFLVLFSNY